jgi:hypothetical protein
MDPDNLGRGLVARHAGRLSVHLADLSRQVREAVAAVVSDTLGKLASEAVHQLLLRKPPAARFSGGRQPYRQERDPWREADPWAERDHEEQEEDHDSWSETDEDETEEAEPDPIVPVPAAREGRLPTAALAAGLATAAWWLRRRGTWPSAVAVGLTAVALVWLSDDGTAADLDLMLRHF